MTMKNATYFPADNGDCILIELDKKTIATDVHYRDCAEDSDEPEYDFAPDLQKACLVSSKNYRASIFVLTHPDKDHVKGFTRLFYCGDPDNYKDRPTADQKLILIEEMWISPYSENPNYETDDSKPVFKEINRRLELRGTADADKDGNRIKTLDTEHNTTGSVTSNISWKLLAPTPEEANIQDEEGSDERASSNNSSLVILWSLKVDGGISKLLIAGDAEVGVWERIWADYRKKTDQIKRHVLLAPHHVSRCSMARKDEDDKYVYSDNALDALGQFEGDGFVVASSKEILDDDDNPPSWDAKQKYLEMLKKQKEKGYKERFLNPDTHKSGKPEPVVFELTIAGPVLKTAGTAASAKNLYGAGATVPHTYG